jgi:hypothetical protein
VNADLSGVLVKIERAKSHLRDFDLRTRRTEEAYRRAVVRERDEERAELVFRFGHVPTLRPTLSAVIGDAIHNLRVALDHLAWQLVIASGGQPNDSTAFPILEIAPAPNRYGHTRPQIPPGVSKEMRKVLDEVQPYKLAKPANHDLMVLHRLDINDKHRQLLITVIAIRHFGWWGEADPTVINLGLYQDGSELCRFPYDELADPETFSPSFAFGVRLNEAAAGPWGMMLRASEFIRRHPLRYIEEEVLPRFERYF